MSENTSEKKDEISLTEILGKFSFWREYIKSKLWILVFSAILGGIIGLAYYFYEKPVYTAKLSFVLEEQSTGGAMGQYAGLASMIGIDLGGGGGGIFQGDNLLELYRSRTMIEKTLLTPYIFKGKKELIIERYAEMKNLKEKWKDDPLLSQIDFHKESNRTQDSVIKDIVIDVNKNLLSVVKPDKKLNIIYVTVKAKDELFAAAFAKQIVANVNEFYVQTKTKKSAENLDILQHQTDSVKSELGGAIQNVASATDLNPNANPSRQILRVPSQRRQVDVQANTAILTELVKNLELSKVTLRKETPLIQIIDAPQFPLDREKIGILSIPIGILIGFFLMIFGLSIKLILKSIR